MLNDRVFVFVPSYNHAAFVGRCLKSIIKQTLQPTKLLVIDDGSKDDSARVIKETLRDCPFPSELIQRENLGLCRTLNQGFEQSAGDYFAYLGSDDLWLPDFLERRVELMQNRPNAVLSFGNAYLIDEADRILESSTDWAAYKYPNHREMLLRGFAPVSSTVFYRRALIADLRWNEDSRLEDYEFYLKCAPRGEFAFDKEIQAAWRQHGWNTSADTPLMMTEVVAAQNRNRDLLGIDNVELNRFQREIKFNYAEILARRGWKKEALRLTVENWRGARSPQALLKMFARLLVPRNVFEWRKGREKQLAIEKHGVLQME